MRVLAGHTASLDKRCACGHRFDRGGDRQAPDSVPSPAVGDHDEPAASVTLSGENRATIATLGSYARWTGVMSMGAGILTLLRSYSKAVLGLVIASIALASVLALLPRA